MRQIRSRLPLLLLFAACSAPETPPGGGTPPGDELPNLANAKTTEDVRAWMGEPCATRENLALPLGEDWLYCVERREVDGGAPGWRLARECVPGCPVLVVHFAADRYLGETVPRL